MRAAMKLDSTLFDRIRIKPERRDDARAPACAWPGCVEAGSHRAPVGRHREGEYQTFCLAHVRAYNQSYNYFAGMSDDAVAAYQRDALTGHRPTWRIGVDAAAAAAGPARRPGPDWSGRRAADPYSFFNGGGGAAAPAEPRRTVSALQREALDVMDLDDAATAEEIKTRYKTLVKLHHPDANGGDRSSEERLRRVIQAYGVLKGAGFC